MICYLQCRPTYYSTYIPQLIQFKTILGDTVALVYNNPHHFAIAGLVFNLCGQFSEWWLAIEKGVGCAYTSSPPKKKSPPLPPPQKKVTSRALL